VLGTPVPQYDQDSILWIQSTVKQQEQILDYKIISRSQTNTSVTHLPDGHPQNTRIQYPGRGIGAHLADKLEFGTPPNRVVLDFFPV